MNNLQALKGTGNSVKSMVDSGVLFQNILRYPINISALSDWEYLFGLSNTAPRRSFTGSVALMPKAFVVPLTG